MQLSQNENYCANPNKVTLCSNHAAVEGEEEEKDKTYFYGCACG